MNLTATSATRATPATDATPAARAADATDEVLDVVPLVSRWIRTQMRDAAAPTLTVPQLRTLAYVRRNPGTSLSGLAEHLGVGLTTASALVDRLTKRGLLDREPAPTERRRMMLTLTTDGRDRLETARARSRATLGAILATRSDEELAQIQAAMAVLREALG